MEKRESYYVSRKNAWTWISAVLMLCSVVARIVLLCGKGAENSAVMWFQILLPAGAGVLFILLILISGETHFYRTAVPVWLFALSFCHGAATRFHFWRYVILLWVLYVFLAAIYTVITAGKVKHFWLLWFLSAAVTACLFYERWGQVRMAASFTGWCDALKDVLFGAALLAVSLAMQSRPEGYPYCPTWGDRSDGRRIRSMPAMNYVIPYIMPYRYDATNLIQDAIDLTAVEKYVNEKRKQGLNGFGITHVFLAAYARVVSQYPALNRFCSGQHIYSRGRNLEFIMAVKIRMTDDAPETMIKVHFDPADTPEDIYRKLNEKILEVKDGPLDSDFDKTAKILTYFPGLVLTFAVRVLRILDYFGLLPGFLLEVSPFHGSVIFTSMASLGIPAIVHHLYDFGNLPIFLTLGRRYQQAELKPDGTVVQKKYIDFTVNTDERICDGFYFAAGLKYMKRLMNHPERLDTPPEEIREDIP